MPPLVFAHTMRLRGASPSFSHGVRRWVGADRDQGISAVRKRPQWDDRNALNIGRSPTARRIGEIGPNGPDTVCFQCGSNALIVFTSGTAADRAFHTGARALPLVVAHERPAAAARERPEAVARERPEAVARERPEAVAREGPEAVARERPEAVAREGPEAVAREGPEAVARERPGAVARERSAAARERSGAATCERPGAAAGHELPEPVARSAEPPGRSKVD
jgi:hypothetical protein